MEAALEGRSRALGGNLVSTTVLGKATTYAYDVLDERVSVSDGRGNTTTHGYDWRGLLVTATARILRRQRPGPEPSQAGS